MNDYYKQIYLASALNKYETDPSNEDIIYVEELGDVNLNDRFAKKFFDRGKTMESKLKQLLIQMWHDEFDK
ncbi:MAG: hypothetical protein ACOCP8_01285 [archaeon]